MTRQALRWFKSSVSFGTISCRSPTTPRSLNSKIGAFAVLVDRDDHVRALHADLVLDRAGDAERDVELRRHRLAGLADLGGVRIPAGVDDRARRADGAAERPGELLGERELLRRAEAAAAGDDDVGVLDRWAARLLELLVDDLRAARDAPRARPRRPPTCGSPPPVGVASNDPERKSASRGSDFQPTSTRTESCSAGRLPTSTPSCSAMSRDPSSGPASRRAARPGRDVGREHGVREQHRVVAAVPDDLREHVDARLAAAAARATRRRRREPSSRRTCRPQPRAPSRRRRRAPRPPRRRRATRPSRARRASPSAARRRDARGRRGCATRRASSPRGSRRSPARRSRRPRSCARRHAAGGDPSASTSVFEPASPTSPASRPSRRARASPTASSSRP